MLFTITEINSASTIRLILSPCLVHKGVNWSHASCRRAPDSFRRIKWVWMSDEFKERTARKSSALRQRKKIFLRAFRCCCCCLVSLVSNGCRSTWLTRDHCIRIFDPLYKSLPVCVISNDENIQLKWLLRIAHANRINQR